MEPKFKIGDKVRLTSGGANHYEITSIRPIYNVDHGAVNWHENELFAIPKPPLTFDEARSIFARHCGGADDSLRALIDAIKERGLE